MDPTLLILDVKERSGARPATAPVFPAPAGAAAGSGFPQHRKRTARAASAFKQQQQQQQPTAPAPAQATAHGAPADERDAIDRENRARLQNMSRGEIDAARRELFSSLDPALLQVLLKRASIDDASGPLPTPAMPTPPPPPATQAEEDTAAGQSQSQSQSQSQGQGQSKSQSQSQSQSNSQSNSQGQTQTQNKSQSKSKSGSRPKKTVSFATDATESPSPPPPPEPPSVHFPRGPAAAELDPADPDFLEALHERYFPNLPADPSKLAWMAPLPTPHSAADRDSPYYPGQDSLAPSQLRFDFGGRLLPPRVAREIPVSKGLHHHGEAPEAAGYTVVELARLARSAVPAQRCIAFQTLGRILYRLGAGDFGPAQDDLPAGLWRCFTDGRVLDTLTDAAAVEEGRGHRGSRVYALEALWLFEKGGWKQQFQGR